MPEDAPRIRAQRSRSSVMVRLRGTIGIAARASSRHPESTSERVAARPASRHRAQTPTLHSTPTLHPPSVPTRVRVSAVARTRRWTSIPAARSDARSEPGPVIRPPCGSRPRSDPPRGQRPGPTPSRSWSLGVLRGGLWRRVRLRRPSRIRYPRTRPDDHVSNVSSASGPRGRPAASARRMARQSGVAFRSRLPAHREGKA